MSMVEALSLIELEVDEAWEFLVEAIEVDSKMMKFSFFKVERDER